MTDARLLITDKSTGQTWPVVARLYRRLLLADFDKLHLEEKLADYILLEIKDKYGHLCTLHPINFTLQTGVKTEEYIRSKMNFDVRPIESDCNITPYY